MDTVLAAGKYLTWGVVSVSVANVLIVVVMIVVFVLALVIPFPGGHAGPYGAADDAPPERSPER